MAAEQHDVEVIVDLLGGAGSALVRAQDPAAVARAVVDEVGGARIVEVGQLAAEIADARDGISSDDRLRAHAERVRAAEGVVARAVATEASRAEALVVGQGVVATPVTDQAAAPEPATPEHGAAVADRQAVRFALVILVLAQLGGLAVFLADGDLLAPAVPAVALVGLAVVVVTHQRPSAEQHRPAGSGRATPPAAPAPVRLPPSPAVRAAEAHLRRQQAAWKVAWWERGLTPPPVSSWDGGPAPTTLVAVDHAGAIDEAAFATMTAGLPAVIRVVVVAGPVA